MPEPRHGRAAPLRVPAGLIVCLACAALAAGPVPVRPDVAAGLPPCAEVCAEPFLGPAAEDAGDPSAEFDRPWDAPVRPDLRTVAVGEWRIGGVPPRSVFDDLPPEPDGGADRLPGADPLGRVAAALHAGVLALPWERPAGRGDSPVLAGALPAVVRGQSPEISLLPLATGDETVEQTSLLSMVTGTSGRLRADYLTDFDTTDRIGVQALSQGWLGLGWDTEANYWQRSIDGHDGVPVWNGDLNLIYNFPPHPRVKFRSGVGAAWRVDRGHVLGGYNVTHALDVYLLWRAMATGELDWGTVGGDKLFRYRIALGLTWQSFEFFSGYESYKVGEERLDGWVNGLAFWY